jgi:hypothetical protein
MIKKILLFFTGILCLFVNVELAYGQTFTFECVCAHVSNDTCDICPVVPGLQSRSFHGLLIRRNGTPYRWIDEPYTVKKFANGTIEFLELLPNPDKIIIARFQTPFATMQGFADSTNCVCNVDGSTSNELQTYSHSGSTTYTNTLSDGGGSWSITGAGIAAVSQTNGAVTVTATEMDGSVTNEGRLTVQAGSPTTSVISSNTTGSDPVILSALGGITLTEQAATSTIFISSEVATGAETIVTAGTGIGVSGTGTTINPYIVSNASPDQTVSITSGSNVTVTGTYPNFTIASATPTGAETIVTAGAGIGVTGTGEAGSPYVVTNTAPNQMYSHSGSTTYTNTLSDGGGSFTLQASGAATISNSSGTVTINVNEVDGSVTNEGNLTVGAGGANSSDVQSNTQGSNSVTFLGQGRTLITESGNTININTPAQTLSLSNNDLSISNGNTVNLRLLPIGGLDNILRHDGANWVATTDILVNPTISTFRSVFSVFDRPPNGYKLHRISGVDNMIEGNMSAINAGNQSHYGWYNYGGRMSWGVGGTPVDMMQLSNNGLSLKTGASEKMIEIEGSGSGYTSGYFKVNLTGNPGVRGGGMFVNDQSAGTIWFAGRPYLNNDNFIISRTTGSFNTDAAQINSNTRLRISPTEILTYGIEPYYTVGTINSGSIATPAFAGVKFTSSNDAYTVGYVKGVSRASNISDGAIDIDVLENISLPATRRTVLRASGLGKLGINLGNQVDPNFALEINGNVGEDAFRVNNSSRSRLFAVTETGGLANAIGNAGTNGQVLTSTGTGFTYTDTDALTNNEGQLGVGAGGASSSVLTSNTSGATGVTINVAGINTISETTSANGGSITITATEVDGSTTNELQTVNNTSNATSHTVTLSNGGGSIQLVEGSNITLTTSGTASDAVVTIASTASGGTPAGANYQVQYYDSGSFGAEAQFNYDPTNNQLVVGTTTAAAAIHGRGRNDTGVNVFLAENFSGNDIFMVKSNGQIKLGENESYPILKQTGTAGGSVSYTGNGITFESKPVSGTTDVFSFYHPSTGLSSGTYNIMRNTGAWTISSGTANYRSVTIDPTINVNTTASGLADMFNISPTITQATGGVNMVNISPSITAASGGLRGLYTNINSATGFYQLFADGTAQSRFDGAVGIKTDAASGFDLHVVGNQRNDAQITIRGTGTPISTTTASAVTMMNTTSGTGDIWYIGSMNDGTFVLQSGNSQTCLTGKTDGKISTTYAFQIGDVTGFTPTTVIGREADGDVGTVTLGSGVTLSAGELPLWNSNDAGTITTLTSTALANVTGLSFNVTNGLEYEFWAAIKYSADATTTGSAWSIDCPNGTVQLQVESGLTNSTTFNHWQNAENTLLASASSVYSLGNIAYVRGIFEATATGTCIIRGATEVNSSAITVQSVSNINWREIK